jgi:1-acyl-sn-glycerol-3-phosphate acyltransferase
MMYWIFRATVLTTLRLWFRPKVDGMHNLPDGPAIVAGNHLSFSDSFFLGAVVPRRLIFLAKSSYFTTPGVRGLLTRWFFRSLGQLPIDRTSGSASMSALQAGLQILERGELLCVYPEGTRSPDGRLYRGRTGVARMALVAGVPVVPVAMIGTERIQPPGTIIPRTAPLSIRIGKPLDLSDRREAAKRDPKVYRHVTDEIIREVQRLSGQEYVDTFSPGPGPATAVRTATVA